MTDMDLSSVFSVTKKKKSEKTKNKNKDLVPTVTEEENDEVFDTTTSAQKSFDDISYEETEQPTSEDESESKLIHKELRDDEHTPINGVTENGNGHGHVQPTQEQALPKSGKIGKKLKGLNKKAHKLKKIRQAVSNVFCAHREKLKILKRSSMKKRVTKTGVPVKRKPGYHALKEIKYYQTQTALMIPEAPFVRVVRDALCDYADNGGLKIQGAAKQAIQNAAESFLEDVFKDAQTLAIHAGRITVQPNDLKLAVSRLIKHDSKSKK